MQLTLRRCRRESLAGSVDLVEQLEEALTLDAPAGLADRLADHVAVADQLLIGIVDEFEDMRGPVQLRHEAGRAAKHLREAVALGDGIRARPATRSVVSTTMAITPPGRPLSSMTGE